MNPMTLIEEEITTRVRPPVGGIDFEQALCYIRGLEADWFYHCYTPPEIFYRSGSRPALEAFLERHEVSGPPSVELARRLTGLVYQQIAHYSLVGFSGRADRGLSEEALLLFGRGWCNEQARVLIALSQIAGMPARLVYAAMPTGRGHTLAEVKAGDNWLLVDQTANYLFLNAEGVPLYLPNLQKRGPGSEQAGTDYRAALQRERAKATDRTVWDEIVPYGVVEDSLLLFSDLGYCNYMIH